MKRYLVIFIVLLTVILSSCSPNYSTEEARKVTQGNELSISFIDVGQGDSAIVKTPGDNYIIIDAGSKDNKEKLYAYIEEKGITKFKVAIATHPHEDHIGNMDNIIKDFGTEEIYMPKVTTNTKAFENLLEEIKTAGLRIKGAKSGALFIIDGVKFEFIAPNRDEYDELNNYSAVLKITFGETKFLLMGDAEKLSEREILKKKIDVNAEVIKIGHHGSSSSSSKEFIGKVNPKYAVISCEKNNDYNHPHKETIRLLEELNIKLYRTDIDGTITFTSNGKVIKKF